MNNQIQYMNIGGFVLGIPNTKLFEVATLQVDIRPAIENLQHASIKWSLDTQKAPTRTLSEQQTHHGAATEPIKPQKFGCRKGCNHTFISARRRRTHERNYHAEKETL